MPYKAEFVVVREANDEATLARIEASVTNPELVYEKNFLRALIKAVTEWVKSTEDGKSAWEGTRHDFNIGDLADEIGDEALERCLKHEGIRYMSIQIETNDHRCRHWTYDTVLADEGELGD